MKDRAPLPYDPREVKARLQRQIFKLLPALRISERSISGVVMPLNPTRKDRRAGSFVIWTEGDGAGAWKEYATGEKGDVFDLIEYLVGLQEWIDAYWWALDFLGLERGRVRSASDDEAARRRNEREAKAARAREAARDADYSKKLFASWLALPKGWRGTLVETYLRQARNIELERLPRGAPLGALRFAAALDYVDKETGEVTEHPAMVAAVTRGTQVVGLHRTYLAPDGLGKADFGLDAKGRKKPAKKMLGPCTGGVIRLTEGASKLSPDKAAAAGKLDPLMIGEGIETTLTPACALPDYRAWAAGSLDNMAGFDWPACASGVILLKDRMTHPATIKAWARVEAHWRAQAKGRPLKIVEPWDGSDFNSLVERAA